MMSAVLTLQSGVRGLPERQTPETLLRGRGIDEWGFPEEGKRGGFGLLGYEGRSS